MDLFKMKNDEGIIPYANRLFEDKNKYDLDNSEVYNLLFQKELSSCEARKRIYGIKDFLEKIESSQINNITDSDALQQINEKTRELKKERIKLNSEKVEYNAWLREQARAELFEEKIIEALKRPSKIEVPNYKIEYSNRDIDVVVGYADTHVGKEFRISGLKGEILNEYNQEVFEERMWKLLGELIHNLEKDKLKHVHLIDGGDCIDGILHLGQLKSLKMGIIESIKYYSEFMAVWINELSRKVFVDFYPSLGNHSDLRILSGKKGDFPHENIEHILPWFLNSELKENPNVKIHASTVNGLNYFNVVGYDFLTTHGQDEKKLENSLKDYSQLYNVNIDYLVTGHKHSKFEHNVGIDKDIIQLPSIVGIDDFSMQIKKSSNAGAKMMVLERGKGSIIDYNIRL